MRVKLPGFSYEGGFGLIFITFISIWFACVVGWIMNLQNLWEYWPNSGLIGDVPMQWVISLIGVFVVPLGAVTGWIW